jgi:hypothetical protein
MELASGGWVRRHFHEKVFALLWLALGAACFVAVIRMGADRSSAIVVGFGLLSVLSGVAYARAWRVSKTVTRVAGSILILYSVALILLGTEDVGGPWVSVPFGLAGIVFGIWSLFLPGRQEHA